MKKNNKKTASTTEVVIEKEQGVKKAQKKETKAKQEKSFGHKVFFAENYMTLGEIACATMQYHAYRHFAITD